VCIDWLRAKAEAVEGSAAARAAGKQVRVLRTSPEAATDLAAALSKRGIQQQQKKAQQQQEQEQQQAGGRGAKKQRTGALGVWRLRTCVCVFVCPDRAAS
jgi:Flp pilus assembly protein TadB